ncbi:HECT-domain-containing protein [Agrocybe pediades]|nr:HECT-domain-containing protein [Agrocybe pediades]
MLPSFGDEWKRKINLGGASSSTTSAASILSRVQEERQARAAAKERTEKATKIQSCWRAYSSSRRTKHDLRRAFEGDVLGLTGLRCLVLIGKDEDVLGRWAGDASRLGAEQLLAPALGAHRASWLVLIRQASLLLLQSVADSPSSPNSVAYLQLLGVLLSNDTHTRVLGVEGSSICQNITAYLMQRGLYQLVGQAIEKIPVADKSSSSLPPLLNLATLPLPSYPHDSLEYAQITASILTYILTIPLLPNRLPLAQLPNFISHLPLSTINVIDSLISSILQSTTIASKIHLASTLYMFISPQYKVLPTPAFNTYLKLSIALFYTFPVNLFKPPSKAKKQSSTNKPGPSRRRAGGGDESDSSEGPSTRVAVVSEFTSTIPQLPLPNIDDKTRKRLEKIISAAHLGTLISASRNKSSLFPQLISYLFALTSAWPFANEEILNIVLASTGGGLVRELYRDLVRRSPLGKEEDSGNIMDPSNVSYWPPILFLADLYSQALLTMGDDEFFGRAPGAQRNPLTLDELISFSKQLLNIAFTLYWRDDQSAMMHEVYVSSTVRCSWETVREKVTKCLLGIHARDSRKAFVPPDHWLVTSQLDMNSFVEAAVLEEQQLSTHPDLPLPLSLSRHHPLSKRQIASLSPRLGILNNIPFAIPFEVRVSIFRHFVMNDMVSHASSNGSSSRYGRFGYNTRPRIQVRRGMVAKDGFDKLGEVDLKSPVEIAFIDQWGQEEAGIDGGGVFKEFFTSLCQEVFDTDRGLWLANKKNELYPNPHAYATEQHSLNWYRFIGRILGKAMYEGILVDVAFASFFLAKWLGRQSFLDDLSSLDPELYNGLIFLKHHTGNVEDLSLNFTISIEEFGVTKTIDLIPNGSNIAVTQENRLMYIYLVSHYRLSKQIKKQSEAFFEGLSEMIDSKWLRMFNQQEVQILIGGVNAPIDLDDLRKHTNYGGLYDDEHPVIKAFWKVVNSFDQEQRRALLRFVTSCSRPPLLGFKELVPNFSIRDAGEDQHRLPTSSTCVNLLKLPRYADEKTLRDKVLQAIYAGAGFDLS